MIKSQESSSSEESARNLFAIFVSVIAFGLNFILLGNFCLFSMIIGIAGLEVSPSGRLEFWLWSLAEMTLALINMTALVILWKCRFFSKLRIGIVGVNTIAAIAFLYRILNVHTGLSDINRLIGSIIFLSIVGTAALAFLLAKPSTRRDPLVCAVCGYDLRGCSKSGCPECGWGREAEA